MKRESSTGPTPAACVSRPSAIPFSPAKEQPSLSSAGEERIGREPAKVGKDSGSALAFVFPSEVAFVPNIGPTFAAAGLMNAALERVPGAVGIGLGRIRLLQQIAEVEEMLLGGAALGQIGSFPLGDEFLRSHR